MSLPKPSRRGFLHAAGAMFAAPHLSEDPPLAPPDKQPPDLKLPEPTGGYAGYAVVGLGKLAVEEVLPAFARCKRSRVTALVSGHPDKAKRLARHYGVRPERVFNYENFDKLAGEPEVHAVYIILPNSMHAEYTIRALKAGKHVLCEKPMATTVEEGEFMLKAAEKAKRKLMIAYRLHYEPFNQAVMGMCREKALGAVRTFAASNCQDVKAPNIRLSAKLGGGPLEDIGIYSLNAARYVTGEEPAEVSAFERRPTGDPRFREVPEGVAWTMRFPGGALAACDCSFAAAPSRHYAVHCVEGSIALDKAFDYRGQRLKVSRGEDTKELRFREADHFAEEMDHFAGCALGDGAPRTPGEEGLADLRAIAAINEAARTGKVVKVRR